MARKRKVKKEPMIPVYGGIAVVFSLIVLLHSSTGFLGQFFYQRSRLLFGDFYHILYVAAIVIGTLVCLTSKVPVMGRKKIIGLVLMYLALMMIMAIPEDKATGKVIFTNFFADYKDIFDDLVPARGGLIGALLYGGASFLVSFVGSLIIIIALLAVGIILLVDIDNLKGVKELFNKENKTARTSKRAEKIRSIKIKKPEVFNIIDLKKDPVPVIDEPKQEFIPEEPKEEVIAAVAPAEKKSENTASSSAKTSSVGYSRTGRKYTKPRLSLLEKATAMSSTANRNNANEKGRLLIEILDQFDVPCTLTDAKIGPSVTKFFVRPEPGIKISRITSLQENIKMALAVKDVRIEAPVPGQSVVGIEIPNADRTSVKMSELLYKVPDKYNRNPLTVALGKDLSGDNVYAEINKLPHMLIAGSTGSGKSVCINSIITALLLRTTPDEVKLLLIDPKKVEFTPYENIPHLIGPVINDTSEAANALKSIVEIMENRYNEFHRAGVRNITEYNRKVKDDTTLKHMVYIVVIIDELADLMLTHGKDVEGYIQRITQLARASGIHLIVATQRPSTDVITGTIKTNIPSRIAFAVSSAIDSRIILDQVGAERLIGYGDMLYIPMGESAANRLQGVYVSDAEITAITDYVKSQGAPEYDDAFVNNSFGNMSDEGVERMAQDPAYDEVKKFIAQTKKASTSAIQRRFGFGYNRAARIIDMLEQEGAIGPVNGSKPREVYISDTDH
ncbi:MAG: DUF87 domain-containing protein [Erysipelotrichaceae bacterium]|nr:DUF87 domain-containing protein [Erysipelotrichaceae bacterium]